MRIRGSKSEKSEFSGRLDGCFGRVPELSGLQLSFLCLDGCCGTVPQLQLTVDMSKCRKSTCQLSIVSRCTVHGAPCMVHRAPCTMHRAPCTVHRAPCTVHCALCTMHRAPCTVHRARCTVHAFNRLQLAKVDWQ